MAQEDHIYTYYPHALHSKSLGVPILMAFESIVLDNVPITGTTNFAIEIQNNSLSGNITDVLIYGSPDQSSYFLIEDNIFENYILPQELKHFEFTAVTSYLRVTVKADDNINIDMHLHGNVT